MTTLSDTKCHNGDPKIDGVLDRNCDIDSNGGIVYYGSPKSDKVKLNLNRGVEMKVGDSFDRNKFDQNNVVKLCKDVNNESVKADDNGKDDVIVGEVQDSKVCKRLESPLLSEKIANDGSRVKTTTKPVKQKSPTLVVKLRSKMLNGQKSPKSRGLCHKMGSKMNKIGSPMNKMGSPLTKSSKKMVNRDKIKLSDSKTRSIKNYFESLSKDSQSLSNSSNGQNVDRELVEVVSNNDDATKKVKVKAKIDVFETLMQNSRGDTRRKTPRKVMKGTGKASTRK